MRAAMRKRSPRCHGQMDTWTLLTVEPANGINPAQRDVTRGAAPQVVAEAIVAAVLADAATEKFGGDSVARRPEPPRLPGFAW